MDYNSLRRTAKGWVEFAPEQCPNGHTLEPRRMLVGSHVCSCEVHHHRTHRCLICEAVTFTPPITEACQDSSFDGRGRK